MADGGDDDDTRKRTAEQAHEDDIFGGDSDLSDLEEQDLQLSDDERVDLAAAQAADNDQRRSASQTQHRQDYEDDDEDGAMYGEDLEGTGKPLRRRRGGQRKQGKQPRPKRARAEDAMLERLNETERSRVQEFRQDFDMAVKSLSSTRRKKREFDSREAEQRAGDLCDRMRKAAESDIIAHERGEPALHKLRLLPIVAKELERSELFELYLDSRILSAFQAWLEPLNDGSLPLYDIRRALFELMSKLPIVVDHLRESRIGPLVMFYGKCPRETPELQKLAKALIMKWNRMVLNISDSYRDVRTPAQMVDLDQMRQSQRSSGQSQPQSRSSQLPQQQPSDFLSQQSATYSSSSQRARVPMPQAASYVVRPMSTADSAPESKKKKSEAYKNIERHMTRLKQRSK
ncbi:Transcription factor iws1 [Sorochytrium milnesiophthora]